MELEDLNLNPEAKARIDIDKKLREAGFVIQNIDSFNPTASLGVILREAQTNSGPVDYLIFIAGRPVGVIEAKKEERGTTLGVVAEQSLRYIKSGLRGLKEQPEIRFAYECTNIIIRFCDYKDEKARSREIFMFHTPEELEQLLKDNDTLRNRMKKFPQLDSNGFRDCQVNAIVNLEKS